jgi:long-chain fatty acid transport protein
MKLKKLAALIAVAGISAPAFATNGMNMEGYGPVATGMGGASFAFDNGTAGMINNPATLGLMQSGTSRFDIAVGGLHPNVDSSVNTPMGTMKAKSDGDAYYMPAAGYVRKDGRLAWGIGMMAQGGMGTEYGSDSFLSMSQSMMNPTAMPGASGQANRTELGIGRLIFPLAFDVSKDFKIGGSLDYLWGGLDLQMVMSGAAFGQIFAGRSPMASLNPASTMPAAFGNFMMMPGFDVTWAQFDFSQGGNKMKQRLKTDGWAGNIGFQWQATQQLSIGAVYHAKTHLADMSGNGALKFGVPAGMTPDGSGVMSVTGKLKVVNFQWPETYGLGMAYQVNDRLLLAADYKRIGWAGVMKNFNMSFTADSGAMNTGMGLAGTTMILTMPQKWNNQNVFMIGGSYKYSEALTLRAGVNLADNPIPKKYEFYLFPATIKNHYALGFGYKFSPASSVDFSYIYAPEVSATNSLTTGVKTTHAQKHNWQAMYSHRF